MSGKAQEETVPESGVAGGDPTQIVAKALLCFNDKYVSESLDVYELLFFHSKLSYFLACNLDNFSGLQQLRTILQADREWKHRRAS